MKHCICGNVLGEAPYTARYSPCRCEKPGPGRTHALRESFLDDISPEQYEQRTRLGLPVVCEIEKSHFREVFR